MSKTLVNSYNPQHFSEDAEYVYKELHTAVQAMLDRMDRMEQSPTLTDIKESISILAQKVDELSSIKSELADVSIAFSALEARIIKLEHQ